jgi:tRNA dimethylallyltransferase
MLSTEPPLIVIVGPTAVGKTELAIILAERLNGEIISADSRLFYRGMDIGTAKPSALEQQRVPHHLIDVAEPDETWSLALFQKTAREVIDNIHARGRLPFLVGGTGQYIRAVIEGWLVPALAPNLGLRAALEAWGKEVGASGLHARLGILDPGAAVQIDYRNQRRTIRALEVILSTGRLFSEQRQRTNTPYTLLIIGLKRPRPELYTRIDVRIEAMLARGLVEEVKSLLTRGLSPDASALSAIGYREMVSYLTGKMTLDKAVAQMKRATRIFVRRQANWFKESDPTINWFEVKSGIEEKIEEKIRTFEGISVFIKSPDQFS